MAGIFISYGRADDEAFARQLYQDLTQRGFDVWWDRQAMESRGRTFLQEIRDAINGVDRLVLVVGPHAMRSDYVRVEWQFALELCKVVVPILRAGDYDLVPRELSSLHSPDCRPTRPYREALEELERVLRAPIEPLGPMHGLEALPEHFIPRAEPLQELTAAVLADVKRPAVITSAGRMTALHGMGGIGKSVLASAVGHACETRQAFADGIFWIKVGQHPSDLTRLMLTLGQALGDTQVQSYADPQSGQVRLAQLLADKNGLIILDDVWNARHAEPFLNALGPRCRLLITTRDSGLATALGARELRLDLPGEDQALELLARWAGLELHQLPSQAREIVQECGSLPLSLAMIGAMLRSRPDRWDNALHKLRHADLVQIGRQFPNYEHPNLFRAMQVSVEALEEPEVQQRLPNIQARYLDLAVFPEDTPIPESVLAMFWASEGLDAFGAQDAADLLVERSLLQRDDRGRLTLHDVQVDYVRGMVPDLAARHGDLLRTYAAKCPEGWPSGPNDGYFFEHLAYHLSRAGLAVELEDLLANFHWLRAKLQATHVAAVLNDFDYVPQSPELRLVHEAIKRSAQILHQDPGQLAGQLLGRLLSQPEPEIQGFLEQVGRWDQVPWLRPLTLNLTPPGDPLLFTLSGHEGTVRSLAVTPDGRWAVTAGNSHPDQTVRLWNLASGLDLHALSNHADAGGFNPLGLTPDGRYALCARGGDIHVTKMATGGSPFILHGHKSRILAMVIARKGHMALSAAEDGTLVVWDLTAWEKRGELAGPEEPIFAISVTPDGLWAATASSTAVCVWDLDHLTRRIVLSWETGFHDPWRCPPLQVRPDGRGVFFGSPLMTWAVDGGDPERVFEVSGGGRVLAVTPDGRTALVTPDDQTIEVWDLERQSVVNTLPGQGSPISTVTLTPDGLTALAALHDHTVKVWALEYRDASFASARLVDGIEVARDGRWAVSLDKGQIVEVWNLQDGSPLSLSAQRQAAIEAIESLWRERAALYARASQVLARHEGQAPRQRRGAAGIRSRLMTRIKPTVLISEQRDEDPWVVKTATEKRIIAVIPERYKTSEAEESGAPADRYALHAWAFDAPDNPVLLHGHSSPVTSVAMTPDGGLAVSGCIGRTVRVWDLEAGSELRTLRGHRGIVWSVAVTKDGRRLASASEDRTVRLWDVRSGRVLAAFTGDLAMKSCAFALDEQLIVARDSLGHVHFLRLQGL